MRFNEKFARDFAQYFVTTVVDTVCKRVVESQPGTTDRLRSTLNTEDTKVELRIHLDADNQED